MIVPALLIVLGLASEIASLPLAADALGLHGLGWFLLLHSVAALLMAGGGSVLLPQAYRQPRGQGFVFIALVVFCVPLFGGVGLLLGVLLGLRWPRVVEHSPYARIDIPELPHQPLHVSPEPQYGQGGLVGVLLDSPDPDKRVRALMATRQMPPRAAVPILRMALRDRVDDVRLLAYSMLDRMEQRINDRIRRLRAGLQVTHDAAQARVQRSLAQQYWELAYLGLSQGDVLEHVLEQAQSYADAALALEPGDSGVHFLRGRVLLQRGALEEASQAFARALEAGMAADDVLPYQAELAFLRHDYAAVRSFLAQINPWARRNPPLSEIAGYWL